MKLFKLDNIEVDTRYAYVEIVVPCIMQLLGARPARPRLEELDIDVLDLEMDEDEGGLELPDYVSTTTDVLPLSNKAARAIVNGFACPEHEMLPVRLINEKGRTHSDDYVLLNLLGKIDCLDVDKSDMDDEGERVRPFGKWCLRRDRLPELDLFRVPGVIGHMFSERLVSFIQTEGFKNFNFVPVQLC